MTDELDPAGIWKEKGADYQAPYDELRDRLATCLIEENRSLWDQYTPCKTDWHLARQAGLEAWSAHEAESRLQLHRHRSYTLQQWKEMHLLDSMGILGEKEIKDPYWNNFFERLRIDGGLTAIRRLADKAELQPWTPSVVKRLFCCWWDRFFVPLEFWTYPMMERLFDDLKRKGRGEARQDQLRKWVGRLHLRKAPKPIVAKWWVDDGGNLLVPKVNVAAARYHGLPPIELERAKDRYDQQCQEMRLKFEEDFRRQNVPDKVAAVYQDLKGIWICRSSLGRLWRWDD